MDVNAVDFLVSKGSRCELQEFLDLGLTLPKPGLAVASLVGGLNRGIVGKKRKRWLAFRQVLVECGN